MTGRILIVAAAIALAGAAPAAAAPDVSLDVDPLSGVQFGKRIDVTGTATDGGTPLENRQVRLESRRFPYRGAWKLRGTAQAMTARVVSCRA